MPQTDPTRNERTLRNEEIQSKPGISLTARLPSKRVSFLGISVLVAFSIFSLAYRTRLEYDRQLNLPEQTSGVLSYDSDSTPRMSEDFLRPRRRMPAVGDIPTPISTQIETTTTPIPTQLQASAAPISTQSPTLPNPSLTSTSTTTPLAKLPETTPTTVPSATALHATPLSSQKVTLRPNDVSRYVSFSGVFADGRGLGNQIFCFAAVLYVAQLTGRQPAIENFNYSIELDKVFDLNVERFDSLCPCSWVHEPKALSFDELTDKKVLDNQDTTNKSILVDGFRQSWRYTLAIERRLRRHLVFKDEIQKFAEDFLEKHVPPNWKRAGFSRVAIHARRGDIFQPNFVDYGYTVPNTAYFQKAMDYFAERYRLVQFITFSQDSKWVSDNILADKNRTEFVHVTHSVGHSNGQDLAIMSMCDHVIMSTGTFGWWGGWLAKGTTVYYSNWPRNGSQLQQQFRREDFFPPNWIPMGD